MSFQGSYHQPSNGPMYSQPQQQQQQPSHRYNNDSNNNHNYPPQPQPLLSHRHYNSNNNNNNNNNNNGYSYSPQPDLFPPSPRQYETGPPSPFNYPLHPSLQPPKIPQQPQQSPLLRLPTYNGGYNALLPTPFSTPPRALPHSPHYAFPPHPQLPMHPMGFYAQKPSPLRFQPYPIPNQNHLFRRSGGQNDRFRSRVVLNPDGSLPAGISFFKHSFLENPWQILEAQMNVQTTFIPLPSNPNPGKPPYQSTPSKIENRSQLPDLSELLAAKSKSPQIQPILKLEDQKMEQTKQHQFAESKGSFEKEKENIEQKTIEVQKNDQGSTPSIQSQPTPQNRRSLLSFLPPPKNAKTAKNTTI